MKGLMLRQDLAVDFLVRWEVTFAHVARDRHEGFMCRINTKVMLVCVGCD